MLTWKDIGCDYGERLTVICKSGNTYSGMLVDFDSDWLDEGFGDSIMLRLDDGTLVEFYESEIESFKPE